MALPMNSIRAAVTGLSTRMRFSLFGFGLLRLCALMYRGSSATLGVSEIVVFFFGISLHVSVSLAFNAKLSCLMMDSVFVFRRRLDDSDSASLISGFLGS